MQGNRASVATELPRYEGSTVRGRSPAPSYRTLPASSAEENKEGDERPASPAPSYRTLPLPLPYNTCVENSSGLQRWKDRRKKDAVTEEFARVTKSGKFKSKAQQERALLGILHDPSRMRWVDSAELGAFLHLCLGRADLRHLGPCLVDGRAPLDTLSNGNNIVHSAVISGREDVLRPVLSRLGCEKASYVNACNGDGATPLLLCAQGRKQRLAELLLEAGARIDIESVDAAARSRNVAMLKVMFDADAMEVSERMRNLCFNHKWMLELKELTGPLLELTLISPSVDNLIIPIRNGNYEAVAEMLRLGVSPDETVPGKSLREYPMLTRISLLVFAVHCRSWEAAKCLIEAGANLEATDEDGRTALHIAMHGVTGRNAINNRELQRVDVVWMLLDHGAATEVLDNSYRTPFRYIDSHDLSCYEVVHLARTLIAGGCFSVAERAVARIAKELDLMAAGNVDFLRIQHLDEACLVLFKLGHVETSKSVLAHVVDKIRCKVEAPRPSAESGNGLQRILALVEHHGYLCRLACLTDRLGQHQAALGDLEEAVELFEGALELHRRHEHTRCSREQTYSRIRLMRTLHELKRPPPDGGKEHADLWREPFYNGTDDVLTWRAMAASAWACESQGRYKEAEDLFHRALAMPGYAFRGEFKNRDKDPRPRHVMEPVVELAAFYVSQGRMAEAEELARSKCAGADEVRQLRKLLEAAERVNSRAWAARVRGLLDIVGGLDARLAGATIATDGVGD